MLANTYKMFVQSTTGNILTGDHWRLSFDVQIHIIKIHDEGNRMPIYLLWSIRKKK